jgi:hypothetical protein
MSGFISSIHTLGHKSTSICFRYRSLASINNATSHQGSSVVRATGSMGFTVDDEPMFVNNNSNVVSPKYGLSVQQMHVLGLTPEGFTKVPEVAVVRRLETVDFFRLFVLLKGNFGGVSHQLLSTI